MSKENAVKINVISKNQESLSPDKTCQICYRRSSEISILLLNLKNRLSLIFKDDSLEF